MKAEYAPYVAAAIAAVIAQKAPDRKVELIDLYVNNAFYRYPTGTGED